MKSGTNLLIAFGASLGVIGTLVVSDYWQDRAIDQGLATLVVGIFAAATVGWQVRRGFINQIKAQEHQATLQRAAAADQALAMANSMQQQEQLIRDRDKQAQQESLRTLAAALRGELTAGVATGIDYMGRCEILLATYQDPSRPAFQSAPVELHLQPQYSTVIYRANADQIGGLGASIAADIALVYSRLEMGAKGFSAKIPDDHVVTALKVAMKSVNVTTDAMMHVMKRLDAYQVGRGDPGSLLAKELEKGGRRGTAT
jgi:hypothetical protein